MRNVLKNIVIVVFLGCAFAAAPALAGGPGWGNGNGEASLSDIIPDPRGGEAYSERYTFFAKLNGGGSAYLDMTISNLGWGDKHGATTGEIKLPGKPVYRFKKKLDEDDWSYRRDRFEIEIGPTRVTGTPEEGFTVTHSGEQSIVLRFESKTSMWKPGNGRILKGGDVYATTLAVPWGDVSGTIDGKRVTGVGMFDHGMSTFAPYNLARKFTRMRHFENGLFIAWREVDRTDDAGGGSVVWVVVGVRDRIVFSDSNATISWSGEEEHGPSGHVVPTRVVIEGSSGGADLRLEIAGKRRRATDLLAQFGAAARAVAGAVSNPWQFEIAGRYDLRITGGGKDVSRTGRTTVELDILDD